MKALYLPLLLLCALAAFALWTGAFVERRAEGWSALLETADRLSQEEDWAGAAEHLCRGYRDWQGCQAFFHMAMEHAELDEAEVLFAAAFAACDARDAPDFHTALHQLGTQLRLLAEPQRLSMENIL